MAAEFERVWLAYQAYLRSWGLAQAARAWRGIDPDDIRGTFPTVAKSIEQIYAVASAETLTATDEYMHLVAARSGRTYTGSWSMGRPDAPLELQSGASFRAWTSGAQWRILGDIGEGMSPEQAKSRSFLRATQEIGTAIYQRPRETTFNRFLVDATLGAGREVPPELQKYAREVREYEGLWDGRSSREYQPTWKRWRRVPHPGACSFCLMLATRSDYTSAEAAIYAGGGEGQERRTTKDTGVKDVLRASGVQRRRSSRMESGARFHKSCRCTVAMSSQSDNGDSIVLSDEEIRRLTTRGPDGKLPEFNGYTVDEFDVIRAEDSVTFTLPKSAPWADSFRSAPRLRDVGKADYEAFRETANN